MQKSVLTRVEIPTLRFVFGIVAGILFAPIFYSFMYVLREVFRVFSLTDTYDIFILEDSAIRFYNLFMAFVSVIFAQSFCFSIWFDRNNTYINRLRIRRSAILNDQRGLNWIFVFWFAKIAFVVFLFFGFSVKNGYRYFDLYPNYNWVFIMIIFLLFFNSWNSLRLQFKTSINKLFLISIPIVIGFSFGLAQIDVIDYQGINKIANDKNILKDYKLEIPEAENWTFCINKSLIEHIYVVSHKKDSGETEAVIIIDNNVVELSKLCEVIRLKQSERSIEQVPFISFVFHVDVDVTMDFIYRIKDECHKCNVYRFSFSVKPTTQENNYSESGNAVYTLFWPDFSKFKDDELQQFNLENESINNKIDISVISDNKFELNGQIVERKNLRYRIYQLISASELYLIRVNFSSLERFANYLYMRESAHSAIKMLRNDFSNKEYGCDYDRLEVEIQDSVNSTFPLRILEIRM